MEKEHTQSVVERAYAFVEDMFGLQHESEDAANGSRRPGCIYVPDRWGSQRADETTR